MRAVEAIHSNPRAGGKAASPHRAAIVGFGLATPLGTNVQQTWDALLRGTFINDHALVPQSWPGERPRVIELALQTAREALASARWSPSDLQDDETALMVGTSKGPIERWMTPLSHMARSPYIVGGVHPTGLGEIACVLGQELNLGCGARLTMSGACASGLHALIQGAMLIQSRQYRRVLVVAAESSIHPLFLGSFQRLGILAKPGHGCRPFDRQRDGFLMSEAAAAVCLEAAEMQPEGGNPAPRKPASPAPVLIERFALGGDATHMTGGDPDAATLRRLLRSVIADRPVDLVHAHGTATLTNDPTELAALESCLHEQAVPPVLYSHKGALGHSLGASGLVSTVINALCHRKGVVPPNCQTQAPIPSNKVQIARHPTIQPIQRSIAIAAGFGGTMAAISLV
jgi:3-oxoacyl-[acyl-carrier-protein] synthase II